MTQNGQPDNPRASRYILKDFVNGRLLYCVAPPGITQEKFHQFPKKDIKLPMLTPQAARAINVSLFVQYMNENVFIVYFILCYI